MPFPCAGVWDVLLMGTEGWNRGEIWPHRGQTQTQNLFYPAHLSRPSSSHRDRLTELFLLEQLPCFLPLKSLPPWMQQSQQTFWNHQNYLVQGWSKVHAPQLWASSSASRLQAMGTVIALAEEAETEERGKKPSAFLHRNIKFDRWVFIFGFYLHLVRSPGGIFLFSSLKFHFFQCKFIFKRVQ